MKGYHGNFFSAQAETVEGMPARMRWPPHLQIRSLHQWTAQDNEAMLLSAPKDVRSRNTKHSRLDDCISVYHRLEDCESVSFSPVLMVLNVKFSRRRTHQLSFDLFRCSNAKQVLDLLFMKSLEKLTFIYTLSQNMSNLIGVVKTEQNVANSAATGIRLKASALEGCQGHPVPGQQLVQHRGCSTVTEFWLQPEKMKTDQYLGSPLKLQKFL